MDQYCALKSHFKKPQSHLQRNSKETSKKFQSQPQGLIPKVIPKSSSPGRPIQSSPNRGAASLACFTFPAWGPRTFMALAALSERPKALSKGSTWGGDHNEEAITAWVVLKDGEHICLTYIWRKLPCFQVFFSIHINIYSNQRFLVFPIFFKGQGWFSGQLFPFFFGGGLFQDTLLGHHVLPSFSNWNHEQTPKKKKKDT